MTYTKVRGDSWYNIYANTWMESKLDPDGSVVFRLGKSTDDFSIVLSLADVATVERLHAILGTALEEHARLLEVKRFAAEPVEVVRD